MARTKQTWRKPTGDTAPTSKPKTATSKPKTWSSKPKAKVAPKPKAPSSKPKAATSKPRAAPSKPRPKAAPKASTSKPKEQQPPRAPVPVPTGLAWPQFMSAHSREHPKASRAEVSQAWTTYKAAGNAGTVKRAKRTVGTRSGRGSNTTRR